MARDLNRINSDEEELTSLLEILQSKASTSEGALFVYAYREGRRIKKPRAVHAKGRVSLDQSIQDNAMKSKVGGGLVSKIKWALRFEGNALPLPKVFDSKEEALDYADSLIRKRKGKFVEVIHN